MLKKKTLCLEFSNAVVRRNTLMSAKERKCPQQIANASPQKKAKGHKRAQKSACAQKLQARLKTTRFRNRHLRAFFRGFTTGWFPKGWFRRMFPRNESTGTRVRSPKPPFYETDLLSPSDPFWCCHKRVVSKRVVSADVPPERKPERGYIRQNHPFTKPPFYLPVM